MLLPKNITNGRQQVTDDSGKSLADWLLTDEISWSDFSYENHERCPPPKLQVQHWYRILHYVHDLADFQMENALEVDS